jgi:hypothetical protein
MEHTFSQKSVTGPYPEPYKTSARHPNISL